jgi:serine/threonine protein phosphatase PrpC
MGFFSKLFGSAVLVADSSAKTDTGMVREHNEDYYALIDGQYVFIVADGMGGHNAGEVASKAAVECLEKIFSEKDYKQVKEANIPDFLLSSFDRANECVIEMANEDVARKGMGCTLIATMISGSILFSCHVGDVRGYLLDPELGLEQFTGDQSSVAQFDQEATVNLIEGICVPNRNLVTNAIGYPFSTPPEINKQPLKSGDKFLLCSDGLWSMVSDKEIEDILNTSSGPKDASETLVKRANEAGGTDNITALVVFCK